jgi:hypothetical protein
MSPEKWGPPIWTLFHTLIERLNENDFHKNNVGLDLFFFIKRICRYLPCPECSQHASRFLDSVKSESIKSKNDLKKIIYVFHNVVNVRKKKPLYKFEDVASYQNKNLVHIFNRFIQHYKTQGNMNLISDSFQRQMITKNFRVWFIKNFHLFNNPNRFPPLENK